MDWLTNLFSGEGFVPRSNCGQWTTGLIMLHTISDILTWLAYMSIPASIAYFIRQKREMPFPHIFWLFICFILICGMGHLVEVMMFFHPAYKFAGLMKAATAIVSLATVWALWRVMPSALLIRNPKELEQEVEARTGELARANQRFRALIDCMTDAVFTRDPYGNFDSPQESWEKYTGQTWEEYRGQGWINAIHPEDRAAILSNWQDCVATLKEHRMQKRVWHAQSQTYRYCEGRAVPIFDDADELIEWIGMLADIHDRIEATNKVRDSEGRLKEQTAALNLACAFVQAIEGGMEFNEEEFLPSRIKHWTEGATRMYGYTESEAVGQPPHILLKTKFPQPLSEIKESLFRDGRWAGELMHTSKDGVVITSMTNWVLHHDSGHVSIVEVNTDITALKLAQERLKAEAAAKDNFMAMLAHELRNPLAPILNCVTILRRDKDAEILSWAQDTIERQVQHMARLVDDLLDVSRLMKGKVELKKCDTDMTTVLFRAIETVKPLIEGAHHKFILALPNGPIVRFYADEVRLAQVVSNLLSNAAKYTPERGTICLTGETDNDKLVVRVRDSGIGISEDNRERIFDPFYQVDNSLDRSKGGLGIGLALVKSLVELHHGTIEVHSEPQQGSEFVVTLPLQRAVNMDERQQESDRRIYRILVVDDNTDAAKSLAIMLRYEGHETHFAFNGDAAIEVCSTFRPDVILLDIGLPEKNGYEVCKHLRGLEAYRHTCVIAMTGYDTEEYRRLSREAGMNDHLVKPVTYRVLIEVVEKHLRHGC